MNLVDVGIVLFVLALAAVGYERGLVASALPLAGFVGGAALGARIGPALLPDGAESRYAPLVAVARRDPARRLRRGRPRRASAGASAPRSERRRSASLDGIGGALLLAALALLVVWGFGAVALHASGDERARPARGGPAFGDPRRRSTTRCRPRARCSTCCGGSTRRRRYAGPTPTSPPPDAASADDPEVRAAGGSTVRVLGTACGLGVEGSGWVAGPGLVVTNAHVVAGEDDTTVSVDGGPELDATAVHYDPRNDLAVLAVAGARRARRCELVERPRKGTDAAVIGYPGERPAHLHPGAPRAHRARSPARTPTVAGRSSAG